MNPIDLIIEEYNRAKAMYPAWPADKIHAAAVVVEECGELMQAAIDHEYPTCNHRGDTVERMKREAIQTAAMCLRFLEGLEK